MASDHPEVERPAFYALATAAGGTCVTLLHPPYTVWHLSYVVLGAAAASKVYGDRLVATLAAFLLAVGFSAHALDELNGRPLQTRLSRTALIVIAATSLAGAIAIGIVGRRDRVAAVDPAGDRRRCARSRL